MLGDNRDDPMKYVFAYYHLRIMKDTYAENIKPINGEKLWKKSCVIKKASNMYIKA